MYIIPAIDILGGECVRLYKGDYDEATFYGKDPVATAREFQQAGAKRIHIVDLDAVRGDTQRNRKKIRKIRRAVDCMLELGGGIRNEEDVEELLDSGIDRLVIGTVLATNLNKVAGWVQHFGSVFIAGIDALDGTVRIYGWEEASDFKDVDLAKRAGEIGMCSVIYTNISKDGTMEGPDIQRTKVLAEESGLPVILSGGVSSNADIELVSREGGNNIRGVITGKAVYEGKIDLKAVFESYQSEEEGEISW